MYQEELELLGYTDERLAALVSKMFEKEITLDGGDDPLTRSRRSLWFREYIQRSMGAKTQEVRGVIGATVRDRDEDPTPDPE